MLSNIKAIIFDMDGTLIDSMWVWRQVDIDYLKNKNIDLPEDLHKAIDGLSFTDTAIYFKNRFNIPDSIEEIKKEWTLMVKDYYKTVIKAKDGVKDFLQYLKSHEYKIGMATSNYMELIEPVLASNKIDEFFDVIVTTCEVPRDKSYPDVFLETAKRLNVAPEECLVFEDTLKAVQGAKLAGMKVVGIYDAHGTCTPEELKETADHLIDDFECLVHEYCKN